MTDLNRRAGFEVASRRPQAFSLHEVVPAVLPAGGDFILVKRKYVDNLAYHLQIWSVRFDEV